MTEREKIVEVMARGLYEANHPVGSHWSAWDALHASETDCYLDVAQSALTALEALGMAVVPREPTEAMVDAGGSSIIRPSVYMGGVPPGAKRRARDIWADMLAASPTPSMTENADE